MLEAYDVTNSMSSDNTWKAVLVRCGLFGRLSTYILALQQYMCLYTFGTSQETQKQSKLLDMCEIIAAHFRTPIQFGENLPFVESWQETGSRLLLIPGSWAQTYDLESTNEVLLLRT